MTHCICGHITPDHLDGKKCIRTECTCLGYRARKPKTPEERRTAITGTMRAKNKCRNFVRQDSATVMCYGVLDETAKCPRRKSHIFT